MQTNKHVVNTYMFKTTLDTMSRLFSSHVTDGEGVSIQPIWVFGSMSILVLLTLPLLQYRLEGHVTEKYHLKHTLYIN